MQYQIVNNDPIATQLSLLYYTNKNIKIMEEPKADSQIMSSVSSSINII